MNQDDIDLNVGRDLHRVSTKAAIYTPNGSHALIMLMYRGTSKEIYGLPGGHVDAGEVPDETIARELQEELGINVSGLRRNDFFSHENGKIVLAYTAVLPFDTVFTSPEPEKEVGLWMTRKEYEAVKTPLCYRELVLKNWPTTN